MFMYYLWFYILSLFSFILFFLFMVFLNLDFILFLDWEILSIYSVSVSMSLLIDWMSLLFLSCVFLISSMVILYSCDYMLEDKFSYRFLSMILLFILSMLFLIISPNMISILLGWDGLGLVSYCLVIYFNNYKSYNAGMLTILVNRIGDVAILMSLYYLFNFGDFIYIFYLFYWENWMYTPLYLVVLASFTKSAQIPFSSWLPAAMAAPTPVSSLVHSSTLVTAGVYLLIRFSYCFVGLNSVFLYLSLLTMFMAGLGANFEYDLKSIIALSTLSQLGMMMVILFVGNSFISFFHLLCHAFFKALLFLCAGLIIHCMSDSQDIRHMGNLIYQLPYTCSCFCISSLSLCGVPFLSGFYSKDFILEYCTSNYINLFIFILMFISIGLTISYSIRLVYYCMSNNTGLFTYQGCVESTNMLLSMIILTFLSIFGGSVLSWLIFPVPCNMFLPFINKVLPLLIVSLGAYLGYEMSNVYWFWKFSGSMNNYALSFFGSMWFLPFFSTNLLSYSFLKLGKIYWNFNDSMWGEYYMSRLIPKYNYYISTSLFFTEFRNLKLYLLLFIMMVLMILMI
uniref:NADH-ubiquinone oxidoreductase chain 5 n=1 Tax=Urolabida sp. FS-2019 TaxID=2575687 RepID=A0A4D6X222_9HEMI|nr:NADH dehydrogenase subunit 5 [Urolabida sp. FS-2019]